MADADESAFFDFMDTERSASPRTLVKLSRRAGRLSEVARCGLQRLEE
jgi:hypothetical protein